MLALSFEQKLFIKKEYTFLSGCCKKSYDANDLEQLHEDRVRIGTFRYTIEKLFNCDFQRDVLPLLHIKN
jgi:hypothetical protein